MLRISMGIQTTKAALWWLADCELKLESLCVTICEIYVFLGGSKKRIVIRKNMKVKNYELITHDCTKV